MRYSPLIILAVFLFGAQPADAQRLAKYGADFLAGGVGARALGMGGTHIALASDVTAGYWNPAGLHHTSYPEVAYMHAERFGGIVQFDYGAASFPLTEESTLGISFFRSGVDDIPNTLNAWENGTPITENVTFFSAADYAFYVTYARQIKGNLFAGASAKIIRRSIGDFANAWGYSLDVGAQMHLGRYRFGAVVQDITGMSQSWSINEEAFAGLEDFGQDLPVGGHWIVPPVLRLGAGVEEIPLIEDITLTAGLDLDVAFDGQRHYAMSFGEFSFHPRIGTEFSYKSIVALRLGISDVTSHAHYGTQLTPSAGMGLAFGPINVDYSFGDFGGIRQELGYSHRISLQYTIRHEPFARTNR